MLDKALAAKLGHTVNAIYLRREKLRLPPRNLRWKPWTEKEIGLLGKYRDEEVAFQTGYHTRL